MIARRRLAAAGRETSRPRFEFHCRETEVISAYFHSQGKCLRFVKKRFLLDFHSFAVSVVTILVYSGRRDLTQFALAPGAGKSHDVREFGDARRRSLAMWPGVV